MHTSQEIGVKMSVIHKTGLLGLSFSALLAWGCGGAAWEAPPIDGEFLVAEPVPGEEKDGTEAFGDDDDDDAEVAPPPAPIPASELQRRIDQFAPAVLTGSVAKLPYSEKKVLTKLIEASKLLDPIFDRQAFGKNPALAKQLAADTSAAGALKKKYYQIMRGPWDRQDNWRPFAIAAQRPAGAGFYPADLTAAELNSYLAANPGQAAAIGDLFTVVQRDGAKLKTIPYSKAYAQWLTPAAKLMREAAALTRNKSLATFLRSRAAAFGTDDYYQSDKDWMDLDSAVEITIGPYEVYEDKLKATKAAFESFVTVSDPVASRNLAKYKDLLPTMEKNLPVPDEMKTVRGKESPIRVVDLVFSSGDARKSVQTIAFNLPNDERVRKEKGAKKVLLRNIIKKKFEIILAPIGKRILDAGQVQYLSADGFFNEVLFHELAHSLGPAFTTKDGKKVEIRVALEDTYSAFEECKADVMGAHNILFMIERGEFPKAFRKQLLISYFAGLFRSVRFGAVSAHGKGAAIQINWHLEKGGASFDTASGRFKVDFDKLETSIRGLVKALVTVQHNGDKPAAQAMIDKYGVMSPPMTQSLASVTKVPVDVRPIYPAAGEAR